jgi:hypothetical protein
MHMQVNEHTNNLNVRIAILVKSVRFETPLSNEFFNDKTNDVPNIQTNRG